MGTEALRSLLAVFGIDVDTKQLDHAEKRIEGFVGTLQEVGKVFMEAFAVEKLGEFFKGSIEAGARLGDLSEKLGIGADQLQKFQYAAGLAGVEGEEAARALGFLNKNVGEALTGSSELAQTFAKLHVGLRDTAGRARPVGDVLADVADAMKDLPDQQTRAAMAMKLFGREGQALLPMLSEGREGIEKLNAEFEELGGGLSNQFVKDAKRADDELRKIHLTLLTLKTRITAAALPALQKLMEWVKHGTIWFRQFVDHTRFLQHAMAMLTAVGVIRLVSSLVKLAKTFGLLKPSIVETLLSLGKFIVPALIIGALVLLFEDLWTMIEGGDSVIGDVLTEMDGVEGKEQFVQSLRDSWEELKQSWIEIKPLANDLLKGLVESIPDVVTAFLKIIELTKVLADSIFLVGEAIGGLARIAIKGDTSFGDLGKLLGGQIDKITKDFSLMIDHPAVKDMAQTQDRGYGSTSEPGTVNIPVITVTGSAANSPPVVNVGDINVTVHNATGKDAKEVGRIVGQGVATEIQRSSYNALTALKTL